MSELISEGSVDERDYLPEITLEEFATQLPITAASIVQEAEESSEDYAERLVYAAAKDIIATACEQESRA
jgi:hypothetical protein